MFKTNLANDLSPQKQDQNNTSARGRHYSDSPLVSEDFQEIPIINMELYLEAAMTEDISKLSDEVRLEC